VYEKDVYRGCLWFYPDGTPLAPPFDDTENGRISLHFNLCQFHAVMELLRTEDPIYLYYNSPKDAALRSGKEPSGKEE
jgi:hypothetical protein